jgi:hypothetical protein
VSYGKIVDGGVAKQVVIGGAEAAIDHEGWSKMTSERVGERAGWERNAVMEGGGKSLP